MIRDKKSDQYLDVNVLILGTGGDPLVNLLGSFHSLHSLHEPLLHLFLERSWGHFFRTFNISVPKSQNTVRVIVGKNELGAFSKSLRHPLPIAWPFMAMVSHLPGGQINDPSMGIYFILPFLPA